MAKSYAEVVDAARAEGEGSFLVEREGAHAVVLHDEAHREAVAEMLAAGR
jgi:hypothetical protein